MGGSADRREEILEVSGRLFATRGVATTTVRDIGDAAGVLSGSLYHHFASKHAIVTEILDRFMADIQQRFRAVAAGSASPEETVRGLIQATLRVIDEHPNATAIYQNDRQYLREHGLLERVHRGSREVREHWLAAIEAGRADGTFRADIPATAFYRSLRDALWATMHWPDRSSYSTAALGDLLAGLFFDGLRRHDAG